MKTNDLYISVLRVVSGEQISPADETALEASGLKLEELQSRIVAEKNTDPTALQFTKPLRMDYAELKKLIRKIIAPKKDFSSDFSGEAKMDKNYNSVVLVVARKHLKKINNNEYEFSSKKLKERRVKLNPSDLQAQLCSDIEFGEQDSVLSKGTGFFVRSNVIATAAHVLFPYKNLNKEIAFVKNFNIDNLKKRGGKLIIKSDDVYFPTIDKLDPRYYDCTETNADWAIVPVDRPSTDIVELEQNKVSNGQEIYCIGHGMGLPKKVSFWGRVIKVLSGKSFFESRMNVISGNSGSPVFDTITHRAIGILVRGTAVLSLNSEGGCYKITKPESIAEGDECQKIDVIHEVLTSTVI